MSDKLKYLLDYSQSEGRVCPMPLYWKELWEMLPDRIQKPSGGWEPSSPLILGAWWYATSEEKIARLIEHINYASERGVLDKVDQYIRSLNADQWAYGDGTTEWGGWKK